VEQTSGPDDKIQESSTRNNTTHRFLMNIVVQASGLTSNSTTQLWGTASSSVLRTSPNKLERLILNDVTHVHQGSFFAALLFAVLLLQPDFPSHHQTCMHLHILRDSGEALVSTLEISLHSLQVRLPESKERRKKKEESSGNEKII
jgi:hypothetical protein